MATGEEVAVKISPLHPLHASYAAEVHDAGMDVAVAETLAMRGAAVPRRVGRWVLHYIWCMSQSTGCRLIT
jgi:hypothetical protein